MFKVVLKYIVHLNFVISTSAGLLAAGIANILNIDNYLYYGLFAFFSTLCVYNSQRIAKANLETGTPWLSWVDNHSILAIVLSMASGLLGVYFFIQLLNNLTPILIVLISGSAIISYYYVIRIGKRNLRELPHLKIHSIALTWTAVIVAFPVVNENINNWEILVILVPTHYLYFVAVAIPFDIRDLKYDLPSQRTIPQVVGIKNAKKISISMLVLVLICLGIVSSYSLSKPLFVIAITAQIFLISYSTDKRQEFYYSILIDGGIGLLGISYLAK